MSSAVASGKHWEPLAPDALPRRRLPSSAADEADATAQRNFVDPDSHLIKTDDGWIQGDNDQAYVDGGHQVIVVIGVSNQSPDMQHLEPILQHIEANARWSPQHLLANAGYCSEGNIKSCEASIPTSPPATAF